MAALGIQKIVHEPDILQPAAKLNPHGRQSVHLGLETGADFHGRGVFEHCPEFLWSSDGASAVHGRIQSSGPEIHGDTLSGNLPGGRRKRFGKFLPRFRGIPGRFGGKFEQQTLERREFIFIHQ